MFTSLAQLCFIVLLNVLHPFYVSVIDINHNAKERSVEVSIKVFSDDLETVLKKQGGTLIDLSKPGSKPIADKAINQYIQSKLQIQIDGKALSLNYIGYEIQEESVWCYFESPNINSVKKINVRCSLLYEWQQQQINIIHTKVNGMEKSFKLDNPNTQAGFEY
ncbi:MAG: hypothetical protein J0I09_03285 [Sphingobacteriia bacterium]|nr:hypothetical protein [Sphingobacteriia bacterium]